jgi:osmoprotectant transport system ATP-binding protein
MSIQLKSISKFYDSQQVLKNINLEAAAGKTTVLIGPSGCGKSTLIRIITGLVIPDRGKVEIHDQILDKSNLLFNRRRMGYVIQDGGLFPHLTAEENVSLMAKQLNWQKQKIETRINELIGLTKFPESGLEKYPAELSGGQKQRVSLMRALMLDPEFLLLDEPLGALDPLIRFDLQTDLKNIFKELKKTVLLVTHDLSEAAYFGDTIVLMKEGEIVQVDNINSLVNNPSSEFVSRFITAQRGNVNFNNE